MRRRHSGVDSNPAWEVTVPQGLDACAVPADVLKVYLLAKAPVQFQEDDMAAAVSPALAASYGSNNWVIGPARTGAGGVLR